MQTDVYFAAGTSHSVCQDYALAGDNYVILADGCSSSPHTDLGARFLVHSLHQIFSNYSNSDIFNISNDEAQNAAVMARMHVKMMNLPIECLDATLLYLKTWSEPEFVEIGMYGDGVLIVNYKDGTSSVMSKEYESGAPFYLNYRLNQARMSRYAAEFGSTVREKMWKIDKDGNVKEEEKRLLQDVFAWPVNSIRSIAVMSDGIHSFRRQKVTNTSKQQESVSIHEMIKEFMAFKLVKGKFVERRAKRHLKNCVKQDIHHYDDISIAAIYFDENNN